MGGNSVERRVADVLSGLGFAREARDRPCAALSGVADARAACEAAAEPRGGRR